MPGILRYMGRKKGSSRHLTVALEQVQMPDARQHLARAFDLILRAAIRAQDAPGKDASDTKTAGEDRDRG